MNKKIYYWDNNGKLVAHVTSEEAWYAVKRLFGMPQIPERKLTFEETQMQQLEDQQLEDWAAKQPPQQRNLRGDEHWPFDVELYGKIRC